MIIVGNGEAGRFDHDVDVCGAAIAVAGEIV